MAHRALTRDEKRVGKALAFGVVIALIMAWLLPGAHWGVYVVFGFLAYAGGYQAMLDDDAKKRMADGDDH